MTSFRNWIASALAVPMALTIVAVPASAQQMERMDGATNLLLAGPRQVPTLVAPEPTEGVQRVKSRFKVTYVGFPPEAKVAFQRAVDYWATQIASNVVITVQANYTNLGNPSILGSAGPNGLYRNFPNAPRKNVWYPVAVANKRAGRQLDPAPDIIANFNNTFPNWHFGSAKAPSGTYDFTSVVLHELGHGIGFLGFGFNSNGNGSVRFQGYPSPFDLYTETKSGKKLLKFPNNSLQLGSQLTSNKIFYDSRRLRKANKSRRAKLYAPAIWSQGSSYSHLDETVYKPGNKDSLMTPQLGQGETIRSIGPIHRAILKDIGW